MKRRSYFFHQLRMLPFLILIAVMLSASLAQASDTIDFTDDPFAITDSDYAFAACPWLSAPEEVEAILGISLGEPITTMPTDEVPFTLKIYMPKTRIAYSFGEGLMTFEFRDDQLKSVESTIKNIDTDATYEALIRAFRAQKGEPDKMIDSDKTVEVGENTARIVVLAEQWNTEMDEDGIYTALQIRKSGNGERMSLSLCYAWFDASAE